MKLKCFIIDDEPIARKVLEEFISDIDFLELTGRAENPVKALALLDKDPVDLIFLDINMPVINGIDFLKSTQQLPGIIITTAYPGYALEGFTLDVIDYLVKPIAFDRFLKACNKAKKLYELKKPAAGLNKEETDHFFIKCDNSIEKVFYNDLLYVEALLNYVVLHTVSGKMMVYMTIKSMLDQLPGNIFLKVHKSFIVNITKIKSIEGNTVKIGEHTITISQNLREEVMEKILKNKVIKR